MSGLETEQDLTVKIIPSEKKPRATRGAMIQSRFYLEDQGTSLQLVLISPRESRNTYTIGSMPPKPLVKYISSGRIRAMVGLVFGF